MPLCWFLLFLSFWLQKTSPSILLSLFLFLPDTHAYSTFKAYLLNLLRMGKIFEPSEERITFNNGFNIVKCAEKFPKKNVFTSKISGILS